MPASLPLGLGHLVCLPPHSGAGRPMRPSFTPPHSAHQVKTMHLGLLVPFGIKPRCDLPGHGTSGN